MKRQQASRTAITSSRLAAASRACAGLQAAVSRRASERGWQMGEEGWGAGWGYLHVGFGDVHLGRVGVAHQHANHLRLHAIDGNALLLRLDEVSGKHCLNGTKRRHLSL